MVGANYMGGGRNAAIARSRDVAGRVQKQFFGRQRFEHLSKNLGHKLQPSSETMDIRHKHAPISLSHAKQAIDDEDQENEPVAVSATPIRGLDKTSSSTTTSSGGHSSSRVLQALDTSDPLNIRAALDRILEIPDLAGISRVERARARRLKRMRESSSPTPQPRRMQKTTLADRPSPFHIKNNRNMRSSAEIQEHGTSSYDPVDVEAHEHLGDYEHCYEDDAYDGQPSETSALESQLTSNNLGAYGFGDFDDTFRPQEDFSRSLKRPRYVDMNRTFTPSSGSSAMDGTPPPEMQPSPATEDSLSGNLMDYEDPWAVAGVMLGLTPAPNTPPKKRNATSTWLPEQIHDNTNSDHGYNGDDLDAPSFSETSKFPTTPHSAVRLYYAHGSSPVVDRDFSPLPLDSRYGTQKSASPVPYAHPNVITSSQMQGVARGSLHDLAQYASSDHNDFAEVSLVDLLAYPRSTPTTLSDTEELGKISHTAAGAKHSPVDSFKQQCETSGDGDKGGNIPRAENEENYSEMKTQNDLHSRESDERSSQDITIIYRPNDAGCVPEHISQEEIHVKAFEPSAEVDSRHEEYHEHKSVSPEVYHGPSLF